MNYWVMALYFKWVTPELVKQAVELGDCSMEDLNEGYEQRILTLEQLKEMEASIKERE
ncbi:XkdX family protein [Bacillus altitudinis]|uniref:Phage portal protein n=1 Tax=Bacillus altitudinis TaxID=293387 RepID=A0A653VGJ3_BACAB|nr:XkdX family protein [Bacillus altitudinis]MCM3061074.1 XkdX family protein [Bacillus altitudinis]MCM3073778.1 XkdX family protein [Bacillus altitudinis]MCY7694579.1 XkdX family protein [Bacillus altitudinis]MDF9415469.1 XkdX family protein [Bacillus altitudinis]MED1531089.1 XkdX family protein [Bacillus altitudinis]